MPKPLPKWEMWKHVPTLTAEQAVALTLGVDPHKVRQWGGGEDIWVYDNPGSGSCSTVKGFTDRLFLFKKCFGVCGEISPSQLTVWAKSVDWNMPSELEELATGAPAGRVVTLPDTSPSGDAKPWLIANPNDPESTQDWYIPTRYFARLLVKEHPTWATKNNQFFAKKIHPYLVTHKIHKRGGKIPPSIDTIPNALSNVDFK